MVFRRTGFSPVFRYSCLHSHSCGVHGWFPPPLHSPHDALLPIHTAGPRRPATNMNATNSVACLSPVTLSARNHLTSELLRTLSRVAASKPTSWLSVQLHILSHLARALGPYSVVWVVSLSTMKLIPHRLTAALSLTGIRSLANVSNLLGPIGYPVALPPARNTQRCT